MQFVPYDEKAEIVGSAVLSTLDGMGALRSAALALLDKHGISAPTKDGWYSQKAWLDTFREISGKVSSNAIFVIGTKVFDKAAWPKDIDDLRKSLTSIDAVYQMNHRNGRTGNYRLISFEKEQRIAKLVCDSPYPCDFDRGIITAVSRAFRPNDCDRIEVSHDNASPCRKKGADSCTYIVKWWSLLADMVLASPIQAIG